MRILMFTVLAVAAPALGAGPPAPLIVLKAPMDAFIDDPFAFRDDGKALAYVTTDGATSAVLHFAELAPGAPDAVIAGLPLTVAALHWVGPQHVLVVAREPESQRLTAQIFTPTGPEHARLGPVDELEIGSFEGKR